MDNNIKQTLAKIIDNMPSDWLRLTTHRLDIYNESLAKVEFLNKLESGVELDELPTAYDYIRLGHPLSCVLEWVIAKESGLNPESVIAFSSQIMPVLAVLRANKLNGKQTQIVSASPLSELFKSVYQYDFIQNETLDKNFEGTSIVIDGTEKGDINVALYPGLGSVICVNDNSAEYIKEIQHVRRRESIAMTPQNCLTVIKAILEKSARAIETVNANDLTRTIQEITSSKTKVAFSNCGLSAQYAIMMGQVHYANKKHAGKDIKFIVPPNCYGGTNDQARRVAAVINNVEIIDLPVDSGKDMVLELERILTDVAHADAVPFIIGEIPTNPRVEIPDLIKLRETLKKPRQTKDGKTAIEAVFNLDQTFCPNVKFFGDNGYLHDVKVISYVSGSKFPSGGLCTAGYALASDSASDYMDYIIDHLTLCDNTATNLQLQILTREMPGMNERIAKAYTNTRAFVDYIHELLPKAKINFVSHELANATFTPSVFSLDLPANNEEHKRELNHKLIRMMIEAIPTESKHCVSYGQLKGCYWTVPATSTQGTTKESDKDYIVRVSVAADFDLPKHKEVFKKFVARAY
ncbi:cystathionine beta-synthase [Bacteriovorax sp. Seq25_V]|uniref:cystathionine beta-synthase n=1 Tax=Bacteriovorax sp. Seq25_V TaxID=1201288 RepID=UPI0005596440|nr:cystathionine beta-synthase [Bacteriovorax sp. Seq25_V]